MSEQIVAQQHELRECFPGSAGGRGLKARYGTRHFQEIGKRGGSSTVARYGLDHMRKLGRRSAEARRLKKHAGPYIRRNRFSIQIEVEKIILYWPHQPERQRNRKHHIKVRFLIGIEGSAL